MPEPFLEQRRPRLGLQLFDEPIFLSNRGLDLFVVIKMISQGGMYLGQRDGGIISSEFEIRILTPIYIDDIL